MCTELARQRFSAVGLTSAMMTLPLRREHSGRGAESDAPPVTIKT
jgi:hypothetical protein